MHVTSENKRVQTVHYAFISEHTCHRNIKLVYSRFINSLLTLHHACSEQQVVTISDCVPVSGLVCLNYDACL